MYSEMLRGTNAWTDQFIEQDEGWKTRQLCQEKSLNVISQITQSLNVP